jgi:hypothetical protein
MNKKLIMEKKMETLPDKKNEVETPVVDSFENNGQVEISGASEGKAGSLKKWVIIGAAALVILAGASFLAGKLINQKKEGGQRMGAMVVSSGGPGGQKFASISTIPSKELPETEPEVTGVFVRREDKSVYLGTGNLSIGISFSDDGKTETESSYDGAVVEVVVTHETKIWQDVTEMDFNNVEGDQTIQQVVQPGSLDDLKENMIVSVWGDKQGDRIVARTISFK